ncbi:hypothetical protein V499_00245 [Pseudogymnoascus sp. VKM F-103]|uniref:Nup53p-like protein n=1 Tax=Pseudogymnoascus verrucosus TaxID=342668 RepID=A0A1B8GP36_9PEZI|nr:uncharacterized protein VE01_04471 [Pseudogymnoascus verrucosus]KFY80950.1 hypothetical protein V499_00245 [Pseudogymnoascus sp. VKM F-103]OBT97570.1 hypothetical protein VE01_04471 [Pseudogymnoascus verrucosus]
MPPLILHNVPDDELYVGEDGIQRPYAMVFPGSETQHNTRARKPIPESGSFGRSVRRSRSKTGTPARKEDPNILVADAIFSSYVAELTKKPTPSGSSATDKSRRPSGSQQSLTQPVSQLDRNSDTDHEPNLVHHPVHRIPTEVILRGFPSAQQYAAISHYETLAGTILEDYPRDPALSQLKFKAGRGDPTALRARTLTPEERAKALSFAGGENWIKITFESEEAAEVAIEESPQTVMGFSVYAELWRGGPPTELDAVPAPGYGGRERHTLGAAAGRKDWSAAGRDRPFGSMPRNSTISSAGRWASIPSPPSPDTSEVTLDTATISETQSTSTLAAGPQPPARSKDDDVFCRRIPTAKKMQLLPASDALLPQQSYSQKLLASIPVISWITGDIIGSEVPRKDDGEFDWALASFYWRLMWWLDFWLGFFGGDIAGSNKDD